MNILAIETSIEKLSISLRQNNSKIKTISEESSMHHLVELIPLLKELLEINHLILDDIDYIAIDEGPGSFTGLRIGITTVRTLSQIKKIPIIPIDALKSYVYLTDKDKIVIPILDARVNQIYGGAFYRTADNIESIIETNVYEKNDFLEKVKMIKKNAKLEFYGDTKKIFPRLKPSFFLYNNSKCILKLAEYILLKGFRKVPYDKILPKYYRLSEAERKLQ
ncbi:MAG: tRNA (adenosine(37)-N6)-threonylcarbamoyltransferase complex dimerization subunit type 1 TsaB [Clostridiales Family XIII bacterium]|jgi:tRNA threonylcarbamoyladenosine biosynthesis protein TsaB|nr:tRNA (adenosine(37)-N6)-threonylcarbamoyltransferase complex dimerization subunit type 1 TsaB [Clostridiales Family XIII bacterium]